MKLKDRLASDYVEVIIAEFVNDRPDMIFDDFLAGFETAKRMAIELSKQPTWMSMRDIQKLGDEDVDE